jgi:hypothetical protein
MVTTIHLGDCLNGCSICKANYHEGRNICDLCNDSTTKENN